MNALRQFIITICIFLTCIEMSKASSEWPLQSTAEEGEQCDKLCEGAGSEECETKCSAQKVYFVVKGEGEREALVGSLKEVGEISMDQIDGRSGEFVIIANERVCYKLLNEAVGASGFELLGEKVSVPVVGMMCGGCEVKLSRALAEIEGVIVERVNSKSGTVTMVIDALKTSKEHVFDVIQKTGFQKGV